MTQSVHVATGQHVGQPGAWERNTQTAIELASAAARMSAELILLPEMTISGFEVEAALSDLALPHDHAVLDQLCEASADLKIAIAAGWVESRDASLAVIHGVFHPDRTISRQCKNSGTGLETDGFHTQSTRVVITVGPMRLGLIICADSCSDNLWKQLRGRVNIIGFPSAGSGQWIQSRDLPNDALLEEVAHQGAAARRRAQEIALSEGVPLILSNPVGKTPHTAWPGNSGIIDRDGHILAWLPEEAVVERMKPGLVTAQVVIDDI